MNPILSAALGSILRWGLAIGAGYLVKVGIWTNSESETYITAATLALLSILWSLWEKYHSRIWLLTALTLPVGATEDDVKAVVKTQKTPALTTPSDSTPVVP